MYMPKFSNSSARSILLLPRYAKRIIVIINDSSLCVISLWLAFYLRIDKFISLQDGIIWAAAISILIAIPVLWLFGLYRTMFRYSGKSTLVSVSFAMLVYGFLYFIVIGIYGIVGIPRSIGVLQPMLLFFTIAGSRLGARYFLSNFNKDKKEASILPKTLIYGAGSAGRQLVAALDSSNEMKVVGFIDDNEFLHNQVLQGQNIYSPLNLNDLIIAKKVTHILLAIPSAKRSKRMQILKEIEQYKVIVKTLPSVTDLVKGRVSISDIYDLDVEDILDRDPVLPNEQLLSKNTKNKVVLVTGAGGSIGSELCQQILNHDPDKLVLLDTSEYALYQIHSKLEETKIKKSLQKNIEIIPLLGSVGDEIRITEVINIFKPYTIYHSAAYKHVSLVEENIFEGIKNNVFGTLVISKVAFANNVANFVLISSDKAVRPTNIMGATKRLAELCLQAIHNFSTNCKTKISIVRFGNVLGSSGSIIPKFKKQIDNGGPITLTHADVTRYFMTIPEAAQLVIQAGAMAEGSDVFILDMGKPIKIKDLIKRIVNLSGLSLQDENNIDGDIEIEIIGLHPGEKLYEELLLGNNPQPTMHPKIKKAEEMFLPWEQLEPELKYLKELINNNNIEKVSNLMQKIVSNYKPNNKVVDRVYVEKINLHNK